MSIDVLTAPGAVLPEDPARARTLAQIEAVTKFMAVHPSFPVSSATVAGSGPAVIYKHCESVAAVNFIAGTIGIAGQWRTGGQYVASLRVGLDLHYEIVYVGPRDAQDQEPGPVLAEVA